MTKLQQIESAVSTLTDAELREFCAWFDDLRWDRWDRQLEADTAAGKLDAFLDQARAEIAARKVRPL